MRIGVVGYRAPTGIGYLCRSLVKCLPAERWLVPRHQRDLATESNIKMMHLPPGNGSSRVKRAVDGFLKNLDCVVSVERTWPSTLFIRARELGVRSVLVVMGEWFNPAVGAGADALVAPTRMCYGKLVEWGFGSKTTCIPMPLDLSQFRARAVERADRLLFCNGWGGVGARKGGPLISELLRSHPALLDVSSQAKADWPESVRVIPPADSPSRLYRDHDACVQPSRWEGLGMQQLEAMACGLPVITTDSPPMNEHCTAAHGKDAKRLLVATLSVTDRIVSYKPWPDAQASLESLFVVTRELKGSLVRDLSAQAVEYARLCHGGRQWEELRHVCRG